MVNEPHDFVSRYVSHIPDEKGYINYSDEEHKVWECLFTRQIKILNNRACTTFIDGLDKLGLVATHIPQLPDVSARLMKLTGWRVVPVEALISARSFFELLANRCFPAATFIRRLEELDYVQEPDIFHEIFGHCPMITNPVYGNFLYEYAVKVLASPEDEWPLLQRLFWFTVEFGLIRDKKKLRAYGGGILSSFSETAYSVESDIPLRVLFEPVAAFRMPYRIDQLQRVYFVIDDYEQLYSLVTHDLKVFIQRARELGEYPALFPIDPKNPAIHILAC